jgi:predicted Fe-Mo cluster-binding NifX family protein
MHAVNRGAKVVLTGEIGPTAAEVLADAGIRVFVRGHGKLSDAIQGLDEGKFPRAFCPTVTCGYGA